MSSAAGTVGAGYSFKQRGVELPSQHRCGSGDLARAGGQSVDPGKDQALDGVRQFDLLVGERTRLGKRTHQLLEEERVPLGPGQHPAALELFG